eukprot:gb/GECG01012287.1/.p1 GENE.gb/GECG01012287.1/~~gb/GECG01012287.1/.p1  ORF type:complete len:106 (+),score=5.05 gb/GECG01012287.1/:1-318(+)
MKHLLCLFSKLDCSNSSILSLNRLSPGSGICVSVAIKVATVYLAAGGRRVLAPGSPLGFLRFCRDFSVAFFIGILDLYEVNFLVEEHVSGNQKTGVEWSPSRLTT